MATPIIKLRRSLHTTKFQSFKRCDNIIPGTELRKQTLLTCALVAADALDILSL
jgi:hypothetical protein